MRCATRGQEEPSEHCLDPDRRTRGQPRGEPTDHVLGEEIRVEVFSTPAIAWLEAEQDCCYTSAVVIAQLALGANQGGPAAAEHAGVAEGAIPGAAGWPQGLTMLLESTSRGNRPVRRATS